MSKFLGREVGGGSGNENELKKRKVSLESFDLFLLSFVNKRFSIYISESKKGHLPRTDSICGRNLTKTNS